MQSSVNPLLLPNLGAMLGITLAHLLPKLTHTSAYLNWLASDLWMRWH